jgi:hypothetical protein
VNYAESVNEESDEDVPLKTRRAKHNASKRRRIAVEDDSDDFVNDGASEYDDDGTCVFDMKILLSIAYSTCLRYGRFHYGGRIR